MIFECLLHTINEQFVVAKSEGWAWTDSERAAPFEIVMVAVPDSAGRYDPIDLAASWGNLIVEAGQIIRDSSVEEIIEYNFIVDGETFTDIERAINRSKRLGFAEAKIEIVPKIREK